MARVVHDSVPVGSSIVIIERLVYLLTHLDGAVDQVCTNYCRYKHQKRVKVCEIV